MKYKCPQCENEILVPWYKNKSIIKCSQCQAFVFKKSMKTMRLFYGISCGLSYLVAFRASRIFHFNVLASLMLYFTVSAILLLIVKFIEEIIYKDLRVEKNT